jgi:hypothetical protein
VKTSDRRHWRFIPHPQIQIGWTLERPHWHYRIDGGSDPYHYWRECRGFELHLGFFTVARRRSRYVVESVPGELALVGPRTLESYL